MIKFVRTFLLISILFISSINLYSQKPADGVYTYKVAYAEWGGKTLGTTCTVVIKGDSITVLHDGSNISGKKGDIFDKGIIMRHKRTGKWIIGHTPKDVDAEKVGGCDEGPTVIDFKNKQWWTC